MKPQKPTNTFPAKCEKLQKELWPVLEKVIQFGSDEILQASTKLLSGPHYGPEVNYRGAQTGKIPIPRITSMLSRSLTLSVVLKNGPYVSLMAIYPDKRIAPYAGAVHDGNRYVKPRRYLQDPVRERKQAILNRWNNLVLLQIRKEGQK